MLPVLGIGTLGWSKFENALVWKQLVLHRVRIPTFYLNFFIRSCAPYQALNFQRYHIFIKSEIRLWKPNGGRGDEQICIE